MSRKRFSRLKDMPMASSSDEEFETPIREEEEIERNSSSEDDGDDESSSNHPSMTKPQTDLPPTKRSRVSGEETKKILFQRIWSEDDVIRVLQGAIDHKNDTGVSPYAEMNEFYQSMKRVIGFDVTKLQLTEKLRQLKKKYENKLRRVNERDEEPRFSKAHDRKVFELSKVIWGAKALESSNEKSKKRFKSEGVEFESTNKGEESETTSVKCFLAKSLAPYGMDDDATTHGWSKLALEDKKKFEAQWKTLQLREFEVYSQKKGFVQEVLTKMAEAYGSTP